ncbi:uncharacterized protein JCM6883_006840 [Sporobolomyces salmoneus]|uniref:uncharacterized protein n=1 Tax=Sporobolomyces salmoneus TaxID=183962 RepID=UPI0031723ECD
MDHLTGLNQAQLAAFLQLSSSQQSHPPPLLSPSVPFDPVQALAASLQWSTTPQQQPTATPDDFDGWLQTQLAQLNQLPLPPPNPSLPLKPTFSQGTDFPSFPAPAQPHAFPPISSSRFHPYDRQSSSSSSSSSTKPERQRWQTHPQSQQGYSVPQPPQPPTRTRILYPPEDSPSPMILASTSHETTPRSVPAHTPMEVSTVSPQPISMDHRSTSNQERTTNKRRKRRTRSLPPSFLSTTAKSSLRRTIAEEESTEEGLEELFEWLDEKRWDFSDLFSALSEPLKEEQNPDLRTNPSHRRRVEEFLNLDSTSASIAGGGGIEESLESKIRRWKREHGISEPEARGAREIMNLWQRRQVTAEHAEKEREREKGMQDAVNELNLNGGQQGPVAGVAIRSIINRYHEAYNESQADIARLDATLSRAPSPHLASAPREPLAWSGHLIVPPLQADLLSHWLMSPGRPNLQVEREKGSIEADHMRIYSSLSPLDLHARGAEISRAILTRDESTRALFGQHWDSLHLFLQGPSLAPLDTSGFAHYDDYSLWHHALMCYLQLCVRYPAFKESKEAHLIISPDLPPPISPTPLETSLIDRLLRSHWDYLRLYLLSSHGGLLRSAVRGFEGVKLSRFDLLSVVGDTIEVIEALKKSRDSSDRILPYDPSVSQIRNAWRQRAFWDPQANWVVWSAATTHFLELSALNKDWALGVKDLPGIEGLLGGK